MSNRNSERRASERHTMNVLTEYLKEREGLNLKDRKEFDPPDPDFIVRVKEESIGVDVTDFSTQGDWFKSNGDVDTALERGRQIFRDNGGPALYVRVYFSREPERRNQAIKIGKRLAHVVKIMLGHNIMDSRDYNEDLFFALFSEERFLDYVSDIHFDWSVDGKDELWDSPRCAWGPTVVSVEEVQKIIDKKNKKLAGYRRNCESVWLAIDNRLEAGFYAISDEAMQFSYRHDFDRIFWIEMRGGNPISRNEPILPAIRKNMPKSRTDVFQVYELRIENEN